MYASDGVRLYYKSGNFYDMDKDITDFIWIFGEKLKYSTTSRCFIRNFITNDFNDNISLNSFSDYFYTLAELRKAKLNELKSIQDESR